ncbi:Similar to RBBP6: E3 ubiquitin-protein ligase RBBP6 (Homo sapiens) [Cotesia congregata]|uniref:Similar to RBBP6: E3 ubiquitin-protein ligase RBBP6 (Homo sapiens) n=1 Tax=Cotesia congregata TaxID=51543 RepID=A0A8J2EAP4_COTCN|nr:Similar to RBBP6: E3 ubiquitin-protein ligase RBBP6 (Homo sapiens) [Cotesia congregata]
MKGTEEEKIKKMMEMSTADYAPSKWLKVPFKQTGPVPAFYVCHRCHKPGHWVYGKPASIKKARGIPKTMMAEVEGPEVPGAMLAATGNYYGNPTYQPYLGREPSYQEVDGYPGYNGYNDYSYQQQTQVIEDPLDEFERYLQKKDAEKRNQRHRTKGSRSFEGYRRSPSPSRKRRRYCQFCK